MEWEGNKHLLLVYMFYMLCYQDILLQTIRVRLREVKGYTAKRKSCYHNPLVLDSKACV